MLAAAETRLPANYPRQCLPVNKTRNTISWPTDARRTPQHSTSRPPSAAELKAGLTRQLRVSPPSLSGARLNLFTFNHPSTTERAGLPSPERTEAIAMPTHD